MDYYCHYCNVLERSCMKNEKKSWIEKCSIAIIVSIWIITIPIICVMYIPGEIYYNIFDRTTKKRKTLMFILKTQYKLLIMSDAETYERRFQYRTIFGLSSLSEYITFKEYQTNCNTCNCLLGQTIDSVSTIDPENNVFLCKKCSPYTKKMYHEKECIRYKEPDN